MSASPVASCARSASEPRIPRPTPCRSSRSGKRAGHGYSEAVTEFHIVGGLHPELTLDWYCQMLRGLKAALPAGASEGVHHGRDRLSRAARETQPSRSAGAPERRRHGFDARRRRRNFLAIACAASSAITKSPATSGWTWRAPRTSWACIPTAPCSTATSKPKRIASIIC